jgi:hypothetical protein
MSPFTYLIGSNKDLYTIKYIGESGGLEVHCLSSSSDYQSWCRNVAVPNPYPNRPLSEANKRFQLGSNDDLFIITVGGTTGTGRPELHVQSKASNYQSLIFVQFGCTNQKRMRAAS